MVIETNLHLGIGFVRGDEFSIVRTIPGVPVGVTISGGYLTFKNALSDIDSAAIVQKVITTSNSDGTGHVTDTGADGTGAVRFDMAKADTLLFTAGQKYFFDIQVQLDSGDVFTLEIGITTFREQVTISS